MTFENTMSPFQNKLKKLGDEYVHMVFRVVRQFPKEETYVTSAQLRRSSLSVILNYIEGYSRRKKKVQLNFYEIAYGSLGESRYTLYFAMQEGWIEKSLYKKLMNLADEIGKMLWSEIISTENSIEFLDL